MGHPSFVTGAQRQVYEKSRLGGDQIFVDLHSQTRTLRQVEIAFLVHEWADFP